MRVAVGMGMRMCVRVTMLLPMVVAWSMFVLMMMFMPVFMDIFVFMHVWVLMNVFVLVVMSTDPHWVFSRQSAAAIFTHYSISKEASSISLPARKSPLVW